MSTTTTFILFHWMPQIAFEETKNILWEYYGNRIGKQKLIWR